MYLIWILVGVMLSITSGYADVVPKEQMNNIKEELLSAVAQLSRKIDTVNSKIDSLTIRMDAMCPKISTTTNSETIYYPTEQEITTISFETTYYPPEQEISTTSSETTYSSPEQDSSTMSSETTYSSKVPARNCENINKEEMNTSVPVQIFPYECCPNINISVMCDQNHDGGNWTIIQNRRAVDPRENFYRPWAEYVEGFGELTGEFWMGLKLIHKLTRQSPQELHIQLKDWEGNTSYAHYKQFSLAPSEDNYKLTISGYSGTAGDAMEYSNGLPFTTYDRDNDGRSSDNCAEQQNGAWWYGNCAHSSLNGLPHHGKMDGQWATGIYWTKWKHWSYSLQEVSMQIRPVAP